MTRIIALGLLLLGVAAALTFIVTTLLLDDPSGPDRGPAPPAETGITVPAPPAPTPPESRVPVPETAAPEYRPSAEETRRLEPTSLWAMDLQSGEEMAFRFAAPSERGGIVYLSIERGSRDAVQRLADMCNRVRGEFGGDVVGTARRFGIAVTDARATEAFCRLMTSGLAAASPPAPDPPRR